MPELVEVERYRQLAERALGWRIVDVDAPDPLVAPDGPALTGALCGTTVVSARRRGKLLLLDARPRLAKAASLGQTLGIRFGMTGTLLFDGAPALDRLLYASAPRADRWRRFALLVERGRQSHELSLCDPRRLGRVVLDPREDLLGPDAAAVSVAELALALGSGGSADGAGGGGPALKARLLDQRRLAGVGNLIADEVLWRASLDPRRPAARLSAAECRCLHRQLHATIVELTRRGGSHTGDLMAERRAGGRCPRDGAWLERTTVGGRTTWWCPHHQR